MRYEPNGDRLILLHAGISPRSLIRQQSSEITSQTGYAALQGSCWWCWTYRNDYSGCQLQTAIPNEFDVCHRAG